MPQLRTPFPSRWLLLPALLLSSALPLAAQFTTEHFVDTSSVAGDFDAIRELKAFDADDDGDQDLFLLSYIPGAEGSGLFCWYENLDGAGTFSTPTVLRSAPAFSAARDFDLADEDGDGDLDLVYVSYVNGPEDGVIVRHFDSGAFGPEEIWSTQYGLFVRWMQLDPWNDSSLDIVLHQEFNHPYALYNQGGSFSAPEIIGDAMFGLGPDAMETGNFSGNLGDVVVWIASRLYMHSLIDDGQGGHYWQTLLLGYNDGEPQAIDIDGDGFLDIGVCNTDTIAYYSGLQYGVQHYYDPVSLEPNAGLGVFGQIDCAWPMDVFYYQPGEPTVPTSILGVDNGEGGFYFGAPAPVTGLPGDGNQPLLADLDGDGINDVVIAHNDTLSWYTNAGWELPEVSLDPFLDTLVNTCIEATYPLTGGSPAGGYYDGPFSDDPNFYPYGASGDIPVTYHYTDGNGCSASATRYITVIDSVLVTPLTVTTCPSPYPVQISTLPAAAEWVPQQPISADGLLDVSVPYNYAVGCYYTDVLGCQAFGYTYVNVFEPSVGYAYINGSEESTVCVDAGTIEVVYSQANGVEATAFFDPAVNGPGTYSFVGYGDTTLNGCAVNDTLFLEVVALPEVTLAAFTDTLVNSCATVYPLTGGLPAGGTYSGDGVDGDFYPQGLLGDVAITYTYVDGNGCAASATQSIRVIEGITVTPSSVVQCVAEGGVQLTTQPLPEVWFDAIVSSEGVLNTAQPFNGGVYCAWTDVLGCQAYGSVYVNLTAYSEGTVSVADEDPFPEQICLSHAPFTIDRSLADGSSESIAFDPVVEGLGAYTYIGYAVDDGNGCLRNDTLTFTVVDVPIVTVQEFPDTLLRICSESAYALPEGSPAGGVWSGPGVVDGIFYPGTQGASPTLVYTVDLGNGCASADSAVMHVISGVPHFPDSGVLYRCVGADPVQYSTQPAGAVWGAPATPDGYVDMLTPFEGFLPYLYTDAAGCVFGASIETIISAYTLGQVTIPAGNDTVCVDDAPFNIFWTTADGFGGDTLFNPALSGAGTHYFTGQGIIQPGPTQCYQDVTDSVVVIDEAVALVLDLGPLFTDGVPVPLTGGSPEGGIYSGAGVAGGDFDPAAAGYGWHTITYAVDQGACAGEATDSVFVDFGTGMHAHANVPALHVWPVPSRDELFIDVPGASEQVTLTLVDAGGREVARRLLTGNTNGTPLRWDIGSLANGSYTLWTTGRTDIAPARVVIAH